MKFTQTFREKQKHYKPYYTFKTLKRTNVVVKSQGIYLDCASISKTGKMRESINFAKSKFQTTM